MKTLHDIYTTLLGQDHVLGFEKTPTYIKRAMLYLTNTKLDDREAELFITLYDRFLEKSKEIRYDPSATQKDFDRVKDEYITKPMTAIIL